MKLPELNTPCSKAEAIEIVRQLRFFMDHLDPTLPWRLEPEEFSQDNRFVSCPDDPICWIAFVKDTTTFCRLAMLYQNRSNGSSEIFLSNIIPDASLKLNPLPRDMYCAIAEKFTIEIWKPFLTSIGYQPPKDLG